MSPKKKIRKPPPKFRCDEVQGERFHAPTEEVFQHNWWEVFCFPYILCGRLWDCFVALCSGTNQCLVYWMMIQWVVCKITRITTPDPIMFPYYFYMFCQVILLTLFFIMLWIWFGKSIIIPYFHAFYVAITEDEDASVGNTSRLSFRRYCFRKSEIFDSSMDSSANLNFNHHTSMVTFVFQLFMNNINI
ncbi:unnamed protein product [Colias eurytheme]|nr:unnamed protein product [Colias eurytheme]